MFRKILVIAASECLAAFAHSVGDRVAAVIVSEWPTSHGAPTALRAITFRHKRMNPRTLALNRTRWGEPWRP